MINIPGYKVEEQIFVGYNSTIYRGRRIHDGQKVVIKLLSDEHPTIEKLAGFRREYEIAKRLSGDKIIEMYDLVNYKNSLFMVMEDFGGQSLAQQLPWNDLNAFEKLLLAINITDALNQIHKNGIIHKDINPYNIIWNCETGQLKIIDFGISSELSKETLQKSYVLEGTLPYISPEQTGKINRIIDYRSDLYSLGIVLYELFTKKLPFLGDDLEIVHCHIAKLPDEPKKINDQIHPAISDIIMKLISKDVEDRYQSTFGLKYDLEFCLRNLKLSNDIVEFKAGNKDIYNIFRIPQKLYGRETEIDTLKKAVDALENNKTGLILVSGYSGIGKTSIIREMIETIVEKGGYFISGKFDPFERNHPYSALIYAFRGLVKSLIIEYQSIEMWEKRFAQALGANIKIIADLIPEITQITGECSNVPKLNPIEEINRFRIVFADFVKVFATTDNPFVIFLDDLQWSDLSTLDLIKYLLLSPQLKNLLIIGAYRDNEVTDGHPLRNMINEIIACEPARNIPDGFYLLNQIHLGPLREKAVGELIADTLRYRCTDVFELTGLIYQKSKGNPFFINKLLFSLYQRGVFTFNEDTHQWWWNFDKIKETGISDNVAEFLVQTLNLMPLDSFEILKAASCIGNDFSLRMLYLVKNEANNIPETLWAALGMELIIPMDNNYRMLYIPRDEYLKSSMEIKFRFSHDRIRGAIYTLIPEEEKVGIHKKIGRILLTQNITEDSELKIFEVTDHFNAASIEISEESERIELLDLNYEAGKKARSNSAFHNAFNYFKTGLSLLSEAEWMNYPAKFFKISFDYTESLYLSGHIEEAIEECDHLLEFALNDLDKSKVYELKSVIYLCKGENVNIVIDELKKGLQLFHIVLPGDPQEIERQAGELIGKMLGYLAANPIESLLTLPKMNDERKIAVMNLLFQTIPHAIQSCPPLYILIELIMFDIAITYGTTEVSCKNFVDLGMIQGAVLGNYEAGYQLGEIAFQLIDKYQAETLKPAVYFVFSTFVSHWRVHYSESLKYYDLCFKTSMESGDMVYAVFSCAHKLLRNLYTGKNLDDCWIEIENVKGFLTTTKAELLVYVTEFDLYFVKSLQTGFEKSLQTGLSLQSGANIEEEKLLTKVTESQNLFLMLNFGQMNTMLYYFLGDLESVEKWNQFTEPFLQVGMGYYYLPDHIMFQSLLLIGQWKKASGDERIAIMELIGKKREALKIWSDNCPANFAHKYYLVCAETAVIQNQSLDEITTFYKKALDSIHHGEFVHMKALIYEMLGKFWLSREETIVGNAFIKEAYYFYKQWGASYKVELIEKEFQRKTGGNTMESISPTSVNTVSASLDLRSVIKSAQAISSEIKIDKLFNVLMNIIIENAGAQNGCLILRKNGGNEFFIEAVKDSDDEEVQVIKPVPLSESARTLGREDCCLEIVQYAMKTGENIVIDNAVRNSDFQNSEYIQKRGVKSVLCMPIIYHNDIQGVIYLENNLMENVFTLQRLETLKIISSQISISIENAQLYEKLGEKVIERTKQLELANNELKELAFHDPLTKLHNRRYVYEYVTEVSERFIKTKAANYSHVQETDRSTENNVLGVYMIDIDHFKKVNDVYGHQAGDHALIIIANSLKSLIKGDDFIIRWGGEEFLVILNNTKVEYLKVFAQKILRGISETPIEISGNKTIYKTCSVGFTYIPFEPRLPNLLNLEQMINISDFALYKAKKAGRNRAVYFRLKNPDNNNVEDTKKYFTDLSKLFKIDDLINIEYITGEKIRL